MMTLALGSRGDDVVKWQGLLVSHGWTNVVIDGTFGRGTELATREWQATVGLVNDGIVGSRSWSMMTHGDKNEDDAWPHRPDFSPMNRQERERTFGKFSYVHAPVNGMPERIEPDGGWTRRNIEAFSVPQLASVDGASRSCLVQFHRSAGGQLVRLFDEWERAGLLHLVLSWSGSYCPRFVRGSRSILSNHAWGTAFDINAAFNPLGGRSPLRGEKGSVRELVPLANECGFYWGAHWSMPWTPAGSRADPMHFEIARLL